MHFIQVERVGWSAQRCKRLPWQELKGLCCWHGKYLRNPVRRYAFKNKIKTGTPAIAAFERNFLVYDPVINITESMRVTR